jgi:hypothetical protein
MKVFQTSLFALIALFAIYCSADEATDRRCYLSPDPGPCEALITRYYFDKDEKRCKSFSWGGCEGVVPFQTLAECESNCPCQ